ncbi:MAG: hypothetical protein ACRD5H_04095 [Nitrososphaerales archaeon]
MNSNTEQILQDVANTTNTNTDGIVTKRATRYYTFNELQARKADLARVEEQLQAPGYVLGALTAEGRAQLVKRSRDLKQELAKCSPPELTGEAKDALNVRRHVLEENIRVGMPTHEQMRRNPVGAVDQHRKWERRVKNNILEWKNIRRALEPTSDDRDLANVEMLRPSGLPTNGASTFMADAQIPGHFAMTPQAKVNWPLGEPKVDTPLKQAERAEAQTQIEPAAIALKQPRVKRERSEAQKAATARFLAAGRAAREKKNAEKAPVA